MAALAQSPGEIDTSPQTVLETPDNTSSEQVYQPDYFDQFTPQTASDMVQVIPGFNIRGGGNDQRGFGEASLNILINGRRPSSKSSGANAILSRIPASNVIRIEILDGESLDIPGLSGQVANIVAKSGELSGSWDLAARFEKDSQPQFGDATLNFSAKRGQLEAVGSIGHNQFITSEFGTEEFFDGSGTLFQDRDERLSFDFQNPFANLNLNWERDNGHIGNLNLSALRRNNNVTLQEQFQDLVDVNRSGASVANSGDDEDQFEIGADYDFGLNVLGSQGRLKLIGLYGYTDRTDIDTFLFDDADPGQIFQSFEQNNISNEYIARGEYSWKSGETNDWTVSVEAARNTLDSISDFIENDIDLLDDETRVEEDRFQANLSRSWALSPNTTAQASIGGEYSIIDVASNDADAETFLRPRGVLNLSHKLNDDWTIRGQVERSVDQLDFDDFVSTVSLSENTQSEGGNVSPPQNWEFEAELIKQSQTGLSGSLSLFYDVIEDPIEQILFLNGAQGPANLADSANRYGAEANLTWVLDEYIQGLRVTGEFLLAGSSLNDPITNQNRDISVETLWEYDVELRYDIPNTPFAIEAEVEQGDQALIFRIDETTENNFIRPEFELSLIHKDLFGMQWTLRLQNILDFKLQRERFIFSPTRNGDLIESQFTQRQRGQRFSIQVTDTF